MQSYQSYLNYIDTKRSDIVEELINWSQINSGSYHLQGINAFRDSVKLKSTQLFKELYDANQLDIKEVNLNKLSQVSDKGDLHEVDIADGLQISKQSGAKIKVLLVAHLDTVFAKDHPFQSVSQLDHAKISEQNLRYNITSQTTDYKNVLNGPGVADIKGGIMTLLYALKIFEKSPYAKYIDWTIALNSDEEIGSMSSNDWLQSLAKSHQLGLVFEPALPNGDFAGSRKGSGNFSAIIHGQSAHAGRDFFSGKNAIVAMSSLVNQLAELTNQKQGLTVNPAYTYGGGALNAVPDFSLVKFNIRFDLAEDESWIATQVRNIIKNVEEQTGCKIELHGKFSRIPKRLDDKMLGLYHAYQSCGKELGLDLNWHDTGGCCDGNNLAAAGLINIDTLGAVGGNLHNNDEFIYTDSLFERMKLSALFLMKLANNEFNTLLK